ncbi:class I tRNA ligase family protein, partial [Candidatus Dojkabacteria bacterium]|nr:class I tRNA ligase family protein [Candidatus Dojkabacteria bacterium]
AQSEAATGKKFVKYWFHDYHLMIDSKKMSKSTGNFLTLNDIKVKGFEPMDLRYFYATSHYRQRSNFTWDALQSARNSRLKLIKMLKNLNVEKEASKNVNQGYKEKFIEVISDDLSIPRGLAIVWEVINSDLSDSEKFTTILDFDSVFGFQLAQAVNEEELSTLSHEQREEIEKFVTERDSARLSGDWKKSDEIRDALKSKYNVEVLDTKEGSSWKIKD